jgi:hypothetical protein
MKKHSGFSFIPGHVKSKTNAYYYNFSLIPFFQEISG